MKKLFALIVSILIGVSVQAEAPREIRPEIRIGVLTDLSGPGTYYGLQVQVGVKMAEEDMRAQGKNVRIVVEDSGLKTQQAVSAAQKLLMADKVDALYSDFSAVTIAISPLLQARKKLLVYNAAARSVVESNPYSFKTYSDYIAGCEAIARQFKEQGIKRLGILKPELEFGELCFRGAKNVYPDVIEYSYKPGDIVNAQVLELKSKGAEAILNAAYEGDLVNALQALKALNYKVPIGAAEDALSDKIRKLYPQELEGSLVFAIKPPPQALMDRADKITKGKLANLENAGLAYLHMFQMYDALVACKAGDIDCVMKKFAAAKPDPAYGFHGFKDRIAVLETDVKVFRDGKFQTLKTFLAGE